MALHEVGPDRAQLDLHAHRLLVAQEIELDRVALEFSLDHLGHLHPLALVFDKGVARNRMAVDRREARRRSARILAARTGVDHGADEHAAIVILQAEEIAVAPDFAASCR